jgi:hypothetical protein
MAIGFFDGNKADASPESIKRKREMIAQLLRGNSRAPQNVGEGFNAIGNNIAAAITKYRANAAEQASNASSAEAFRNIYSGFGSPTASAGNPVATGRATGSGATGAVSGKGYDNPQARETYEYALAQGLAPHQAAAYTGAKLAESRFDPNARNPGDGRDGTDSIGGFQWNSGRAQALKQFAAQQGKNWNDPAVQRAFSFAELNGSERAAGQALRNARTPEEATAAMLSYLRPGGWTARNPLGAHSAPARLRNTQGILSAFGNMPVINPGNGATPMPLASQQARTAPMPNAGLADLPAPGANQSGMTVAPVQGDNAQQLLADADYYEQNGNPEAARQMRERAAMAGQSPSPDGAFQAPLDGSQPDPLRDMFSARGVGFADNEAETQGFEARMAQEQAGVPMPDPSQVQTVAITPNAQNADDVFSPVPMGIGANPFVPRNMAPPADVAAQGAETTAVSPRMVTAPMPPPRPANIAPPQSPFVPPAMRQPIAPMEASENGAGAMQFIESEFARREGRPDPRSAIGAPPAQIYNAFVQQPTQAPQMPAGGGSVQGVSQGDTMASGPAQAPAQANSRIAELASIAGNPMVRPEVRQLAMAEIQTERARAQAEAERARTEAQNRQTARDLGLPESLGGVGPVVTARAQQKYAKPEAATTDQRELEQVNRERQNANLPALRMDEWKTQKARAGATSIVNDLTGGSSKQVFDTLKERAEAAQTAATGLNALREARKAVTDGGFFGAGADQRLGFAKLGQLLGFEDGRITNTETFRSAIAPQVAAVMKATVGSTQISNADREFAEKAAGGSIALDDKSINRLLNIMERGSNDIISRHQRQLDAVYPDGPDGKFARERALFGVQAPAAPTQTGPARPSSKAEFDALPSGSTFIAPDGTTRRKP